MNFPLKNSYCSSDRTELSAGQKLLWFIHSLGGKAQSAYNESLVFSLEGYLSFKALNLAVNLVIKKHDIYRACFEKDNLGNLFQFLNENQEIAISIIDVTACHDLDEKIFKEIEKPFDLKKNLLIRLSLFKINDMQYKLVIVQHHIITDGISSLVFVQELCFFYNKLLRGEEIVGGDSCSGYFDHILLESKKFITDSYMMKVDKMAKSLEGFSGLNFLMTLKKHKQGDVFSGNRVLFSLNKELSMKLENFSRMNNITLFHFLFSA